jgi:hypothetical protein
MSHPSYVDLDQSYRSKYNLILKSCWNFVANTEWWQYSTIHFYSKFCWMLRANIIGVFTAKLDILLSIHGFFCWASYWIIVSSLWNILWCACLVSWLFFCMYMAWRANVQGCVHIRPIPISLSIYLINWIHSLQIINRSWRVNSSICSLFAPLQLQYMWKHYNLVKKIIS